MRHKGLMLAIVLGMLTPAFGAVPPLATLVPNAGVVGQGTLSVVFFNIYNAKLYAPAGKLQNTQPFALEMTYLRAVSGADIIDHSVNEIRNQGATNPQTLTDWQNQLAAIFTDVTAKTVLLAVFMPTGETLFYRDNRPIGTIKDAELSKRFANIWLGNNTSQPALRRQLLGL